MEIREQRPEDLDALLAFWEAVPVEERTFLKEDVVDRKVIESWLHDERSHRAIACEAGRIAGVVAVVPLVGWSDHVGEVRMVVAPDHRRSGLGRALARWALITAIESGLHKLVVEVVAEQEGAVAMFQSLGFRGEALLQDHIRARNGEMRDLILLAHPVTEQAEAMAMVGIGGV